MAEEPKISVEIKAKRPQTRHLKPYKKGQSGNLKGHPLGQRNYATLYKEALIKLAERNNETPADLELKLFSKGIVNAVKGDYRFYKDVLDRLLGQATQKTDITSGGKVLTGFNYIKPDGKDNADNVIKND